MFFIIFIFKLDLVILIVEINKLFIFTKVSKILKLTRVNSLFLPSPITLSIKSFKPPAKMLKNVVLRFWRFVIFNSLLREVIIFVFQVMLVMRFELFGRSHLVLDGLVR